MPLSRESVSAKQSGSRKLASFLAAGPGSAPQGARASPRVQQGHGARASPRYDRGHQVKTLQDTILLGLRRHIMYKTCVLNSN